MTDKPKGHPHIRKPKPSHPWKAQGVCSRKKSERAAEPPSIAERKPSKRWSST